MSGEATSLRQTCPECGRTSRPNATECRKCGHAFPPRPGSGEVAAVLERESRERTERRLSRRSKLGLPEGEAPAAPLAAIASEDVSSSSATDADVVLQVVAAERKARRASIRQVRQDLVNDVDPGATSAARTKKNADVEDEAVADKAAARRKLHREEAEAHDRVEAAKVGAHIERAADVSAHCGDDATTLIGAPCRTCWSFSPPKGPPNGSMTA